MQAVSMQVEVHDIFSDISEKEFNITNSPTDTLLQKMTRGDVTPKEIVNAFYKRTMVMGSSRQAQLLESIHSSMESDDIMSRAQLEELVRLYRTDTGRTRRPSMRSRF